MSIRVLVADDESIVRAGFRLLLSGKHDIEVKVLLACTEAEQRRILAVHNRGTHRAVLLSASAGREAAPRRRT